MTQTKQKHAAPTFAERRHGCGYENGGWHLTLVSQSRRTDMRELFCHAGSSSCSSHRQTKQPDLAPFARHGALAPHHAGECVHA